MNYVTTNTTGCIIPNYSNSTYVCNPNSYKYTYSCDIADSCFIRNPSDEYKRRAVEAIYKMGYITEEEAKELITLEIMRRNECTIIRLDDFSQNIIISCYEETSTQENVILQENILFQFSYIKSTGNVIEIEHKYILI